MMMLMLFLAVDDDDDYDNDDDDDDDDDDVVVRLQRYWASQITKESKEAGDASLKTAFKRLRDRVKELARTSEELLEEMNPKTEEEKASLRGDEVGEQAWAPYWLDRLI